MDPKVFSLIKEHISAEKISLETRLINNEPFNIILLNMDPDDEYKFGTSVCRILREMAFGPSLPLLLHRLFEKSNDFKNLFPSANFGHIGININIHCYGTKSKNTDNQYEFKFEIPFVGDILRHIRFINPNASANNNFSIYLDLTKPDGNVCRILLSTQSNFNQIILENYLNINSKEYTRRHIVVVCDQSEIQHFDSIILGYITLDEYKYAESESYPAFV